MTVSTWGFLPSVGFPPIPNARTLTIEAVFVQVLLELVRRETSVLVHREVGQAFYRVLRVCVLHLLWIDKGLAD